MLIVSSVFWDHNHKSEHFSRGYSELWVEKLYRGFKRNLTVPFEFHLFTDRVRSYCEPIRQHLFAREGVPDYGHCVEPFKLNRPMIFVGLDTVILGNIDKQAQWALEHFGELALPKHPYEPWSINGVVLFGGGNPDIYNRWDGENDMDWMRSFPHSRIDDLWPGRVVSFKAHVRKKPFPQDARIVYFHGDPKPNELDNEPWVKLHWR